MIKPSQARKLHGLISHLVQTARTAAFAGIYEPMAADHLRKEHEKARRAVNSYVQEITVMEPETAPAQLDEPAVINSVMYMTKDPTAQLSEPGDVPAMTTMLIRVCENDTKKFDEAMRLVELFIKQARK